MRLEEFDTTGMKNWLGRRRDAFLAGVLNNKTAEGRFKMSLITKKLTDAYRMFLGGHGLKPSPQSLALFLNHFFPDNLSQLEQQFPWLGSSSGGMQSSSPEHTNIATPAALPAPNAPTATPAAKSSTAAPNQSSNGTAPVTGSPTLNAAPSTEDERDAAQKAYNEWNGLRADFDHLLSDPNTTESELASEIKQIEQFASRGNHARGWVKNYLRQLQSNSIIASRFPNITKAINSATPAQPASPPAPQSAAASSPTAPANNAAPDNAASSEPSNAETQHGPKDAHGRVIAVGNKLRKVVGRPAEATVAAIKPNGIVQVNGSSAGRKWTSAIGHPEQWQVVETRKIQGHRLNEAPLLRRRSGDPNIAIPSPPQQQKPVPMNGAAPIGYTLRQRSGTASTPTPATSANSSAASVASGGGNPPQPPTTSPSNEPDDGVSIPRPPGGWSSTSSRMPNFLQRQTNGKPLTPAQINQVMLALARMLNMNGQATVTTPGQAPAPTPASRARTGTSSGGYVDPVRLLNTRIDQNALMRASLRAHATPDDLRPVQTFLAQQPGQSATVNDILTKMHNKVSPKILAAILYSMGH